MIVLPVDGVVAHGHGELRTGLAKHLSKPDAAELQRWLALVVPASSALWQRCQVRHFCGILSQELEARHALEQLVRCVQRAAHGATGDAEGYCAGGCCCGGWGYCPEADGLCG